jgi:TolB-like protein
MKKIILLLWSLLLLFPTQVSYAKPLGPGLDDISSRIEKEMPALGKAKIGVVDFVDINDKSSELGKYLAEELISRLVNSGRFDVLERKLLKKLLAEHSLNLSGVIDADTAKKAGAILGIETLCSGTITDLGDYVKVNARMVSAETGKIMVAAAVEIDKDKTIRHLLGEEEKTGAPAKPGQNNTIFFSDGFDDSPSPLWGNERGFWFASDGRYWAHNPSNYPMTYSALPYDLQDFAIDMDISGVSDGGVWLRSHFDKIGISGVLLVTGGWSRTGTGFYWHIVHNDQVSPALNMQTGYFHQGDNIHVRVKVRGQNYAVFLNGSKTAATTLTNGEFTSGRVGLYSFSGQGFDNVRIETFP